MKASKRRRRAAARLAIYKRHHPNGPELDRLRRELDEERVRDVVTWCGAAVVNLPDTGEIADAVTEVRKLALRMARPGGEAA